MDKKRSEEHLSTKLLREEHKNEKQGKNDKGRKEKRKKHVSEKIDECIDGRGIRPRTCTIKRMLQQLCLFFKHGLARDV